jgi:hypothetical protein
LEEKECFMQIGINSLLLPGELDFRCIGGKVAASYFLLSTFTSTQQRPSGSGSGLYLEVTASKRRDVDSLRLRFQVLLLKRLEAT